MPHKLRDGNHVIFLGKAISTFVSRLVHRLVRLCDNEDFYDSLPQIKVVIFPPFLPP